jgi:hypothetical protein
MADINVQDLVNLEALISRLTVAYDQYFAGGLKKEPYELVKQVEDLFRTANRPSIKNPAYHFRYNSILARYNAQKHVWDRRKRAMEGGEPVKVYGVKTIAKTAQKEVHGPRREGPAFHYPAKEPDTFLFVIKEKGLPDHLATEIYERYVSLRRRNNEPVEKVGFETFRKTLTQHVAKLQEKAGGAPVSLRLETQESKTKITAKPARHKKG